MHDSFAAIGADVPRGVLRAGATTFDAGRVLDALSAVRPRCQALLARRK